MRRLLSVTLAGLIAVCAGLAGLLAGVSLPANAVTSFLTGNPASTTFNLSTSESSLSKTSAIDAGFARAMMQHHNQALLLADLVKNHPDTLIRDMAAAIRLKQLHENGQMTGWLTAWGEPTFAVNAMEWVEKTTLPLSPDDVLYISRCTANPGQMPGLIGADDIGRLKSAPPAEQSRLFLTYMRRHHEGAIDMAFFAARHATQPFVKRFALGVVKEQGREIAWINQQLASVSQ